MREENISDRGGERFPMASGKLLSSFPNLIVRLGAIRMLLFLRLFNCLHEAAETLNRALRLGIEIEAKNLDRGVSVSELCSFPSFSSTLFPEKDHCETKLASYCVEWVLNLLHRDRNGQGFSGFIHHSMQGQAYRNSLESVPIACAYGNSRQSVSVCKTVVKDLS
ncbi:hypothetical protein Cni_G17066 [Canna indica]|uniref:Uncharacterized protein n=1 Tax=Canna indica TaxID=4628 RepID=A0AAQ3KGE4_9LILI|nr:hypothetical protein Cni_G17066 [Canna indica]